MPLKALVSQINYNLFDIELGDQQKQFAYLQAKDLADAVDGVMRTHDVALWNGNDTSLARRPRRSISARSGRSRRAETRSRSTTSAADRRRLQDARLRRWCRTRRTQVRPTAIYANPVLLDLIDREMKTEFNVVLNTDGDHGRVHG